MQEDYCFLIKKSMILGSKTRKLDFSAKFVYTCVNKVSYTQPMPTKNPIRLSVSEAARMFGVSSMTIRRAIKDQEVTYVVVHGRYKINFESLLRWSQRTTTVRHKRDESGIGQFVEQWKIKNRLFSPNPHGIKEDDEPSS